MSPATTPDQTAAPQRHVGRLEVLIRTALFLLPVLAVAGPWLSLHPGAGGQPYAYRVVGVLLLPVAAVIGWRRRRDLVVLLVSISLLWIVGWAWASLLWTPSRSTGVKEVFAISSSALVAWVTFVLTGGRTVRVRWLVRGWLLALAVSAVVALIEVTTGFHFVVAQGLVENWHYRHAIIAGFANNPNGLTALLLLALGALFGTIVVTHGWRQVLAALAVPVASLMVVATNSRGGMLAVGALAVCALVTAALRRRDLGRRTLVTLVVAAIVAPIIALGVPAEQLARLDQGPNPYAYHLPPEVVGPSCDPATNPACTSTGEPGLDATQQAESDALRITLIKTALRYFAEKPIEGQGAGSFMYLQKNDPAYHGPLINAHDLPAQWLAHYGLVGAIPLLALIVLPLCGLVARRVRPLFTLELWGALAGFGVTAVLAADATGEPFTWAALACAWACAWARLRSRASD